MNMILILFACLGLTITINHGIILDKIGIRPLWERINFFKELFKCSMCTGFWVGLLFAFVVIIYMLLFAINPVLSMVFFYLITLPFASSGFCWLLERLSILIDENIKEE